MGKRKPTRAELHDLVEHAKNARSPAEFARYVRELEDRSGCSDVKDLFDGDYSSDYISEFLSLWQPIPYAVKSETASNS